MPHANSLANLRQGGGRSPGTPNKFNASIKDMVLTALQTVGGAEYLARQAEKNPAAFLGLVGRVLPTQITGADGGAINWVIRIPSEPSNAEEWFVQYAPKHIQDARKLEPKDTIDGEVVADHPQRPQAPEGVSPARRQAEENANADTRQSDTDTRNANVTD